MDKNTWLEILSYRICESIPSNYAMEWDLKFSESVNISSDLNKIKIPFLIFIVESVIDKFDHDKFPDVKTSISNILKLFKENTNDKKSAAADAAAFNAAYADFDAAARAADSAAADASYAASRASDSAASADASTAAYAARAAAMAAYAAAYYAASADAAADDYAADAAMAAARAAYYAASASASGDAYIAEKENYYKKLADKLLELIEEYK